MLWLVRFLEVICDPDTLRSRIRYHLSELQSGDYDTEGALKAFELSEDFFYDEKYMEDWGEQFTVFLLLLLTKSQYPFLYDYFTNERGTALKVRDRFKPIWYALMHYMKEQYPLEYLRMGEELRETVEEIIQKVEKMREEYA